MMDGGSNPPKFLLVLKQSDSKTNIYIYITQIHYTVFIFDCFHWLYWSKLQLKTSHEYFKFILILYLEYLVY